ncbi:response regulator [Candidatus Woesearchaeota archaeon]|nr:response regulator [Candidatus Woesearchaeota archaeon]
MIKILIVEDKEQYLKTMTFVLQNHFAVDTAASLQTALNKIQKEHYDLILLDAIFPERDGRPLGDGHGNLSSKDFRGKTVLELARSKKIPVIGISSNPEYYQNENLALNLHKRDIDLVALPKIINEIVEKNVRPQ